MCSPLHYRSFKPLVGLEPTYIASKATVLSIERQRHGSGRHRTFGLCVISTVLYLLSYTSYDASDRSRTYTLRIISTVHSHYATEAYEDGRTWTYTIPDLQSGALPVMLHLLMGRTGLEPAPTGFQSQYPSFGLPSLMDMEKEGLEPSTPCVQNRCSSIELHPHETSGRIRTPVAWFKARSPWPLDDRSVIYTPSGIWTHVLRLKVWDPWPGWMMGAYVSRQLDSNQHSIGLQPTALPLSYAWNGRHGWYCPISPGM